MRNQWLSVAAFAACSINVPAVAATPPAASAELATAIVQATGAGDAFGYDGVVEAVRQTVIAAQVSGAVVALDVRVGDVVKAGQVLARLDAKAAEQAVAASDAQVVSARATLAAATMEYERQKQLYERKYTSQAALERAEAQFKSTQAQVSAQIAQAAVAHTQSGFFVVKAPYAGVVAEVPVALGDMAMPGRALLTLYDPSALRVTAAVPQSAVGGLPANAVIRIELPGLPAERGWITPVRVELLPTVDPSTHTGQLRLDLPTKVEGIKPGTFARVWLPGERGSAIRLFVPTRAVVRRVEMTGLYVIDANGRPVLRQVRLGRSVGDKVEVLAGVSGGERVAVDPPAAARVR